MTSDCDVVLLQRVPSAVSKEKLVLVGTRSYINLNNLNVEGVYS